LLIEAPLSISFNKAGNPTGRRIERNNNKHRYWYVGPGASVMVAAMHLVQNIAKMHVNVPIRLFEGFISFKEKSKSSNHRQDVERLRHVVKDPKKFPNSIIAKERLKVCASDHLESAFKLMNLDCGVPVVIDPSRQGPI